MKKVAIVILNWNGKELLSSFLPKVIEYSPEADIVVADNASTDDSISFLQENFPSVKIVQNKENGGFAKGYNDALQFVDAELFVLLNSDVEVTPGWLTPLLECMEDPSIGGCQPKIRAFDKRTMFEYAGACGGYIDRNYFPFCRGRILHHIEEDQGQYDSTTEVFWVSGAAFVVRAALFREVGGFDTAFFAHMEEIDLCWRIKKRGHRLLVVPSSIVYHVGGGTLSYNSPKKVYLNFRNNLRMIVKNHEGWIFPALFTRMSLDGIAGVRFLVRGEFTHLWSVLKAHFSLYQNLGKLWKQRKEIQQSITTSNSAGLYTGSILWAVYFKGIRRFSELNQRLFK